MRCWPHRRPWRLFVCIPCRDENAHMVRCQPHRYVHLFLCSRQGFSSSNRLDSKVMTAWVRFIY
ncbi:hypothetical protein Hanom_Chr06g00572361 [Helianthus anomalus]